MIRWVKRFELFKKRFTICSDSEVVVMRSENLLGAIRKRVREGPLFPGASRPDPSRHGSVESLRKLSLVNGHGQSSTMQHLFISKQFSLRTIHSLALRSIFAVFLHHGHDLVTHLFFQIKRPQEAEFEFRFKEILACFRESQSSFALDGIKQYPYYFQRERERE